MVETKKRGLPVPPLWVFPLVALVGIAVVTYRYAVAPWPTATPPAAVAPAPELQVTEPPCAREECSERPARLECLSGSTYTGAGYCKRYEIKYEWVCTCVARGAPAPSGSR